MRVFKFRIWDKEYKDWVKSDYSGLTCDGDILIYHESYQRAILPSWILEKNNKFIVQMSTGLFDKNNKQIYEGDICERDNYDGLYDVRYYVSAFYWGGVYENEEAFLRNRVGHYDIDILVLKDSQQCKIIGNILENQELLNKKTKHARR